MDNQITPIEQAQKGLADMQRLKAQMDEFGLNCQKIKVTDEMTLAVSQQNLSKATQMNNLVEDKRKDLKAPYLEAGKTIDSAAKSITEQLNKGISHIKSEVAAWEKQRLAKEAEKQAEINKQLEFNQITPESAEIKSKQLEESASITATKNIRYTWGFEEIDITKCPAAWLKIDEQAIKQYIKENSDELKDGIEIAGIRFFKKMSVVS